MATREQLIEDFADHKLATGEKFVRLINSTKAVQEPVADPAASGTSLSFIDSISQDADGKITATKKTLDLANAHELNPFKGWYKTGDTLPTDGFDGAYLYFKDTSELTGQTTIYRWNGTAYADTGTVVDTSNVQTFETGQALNGVAIDGTGLVNPAANALAKAGDVMSVKGALGGVTFSEGVPSYSVGDGYVSGASGEIRSYSTSKHVVVTLPAGCRKVRFLGVRYAANTNAGFAFYGPGADDVLAGTPEFYERDSGAGSNELVEYVREVPEDAKYFKTCALIGDVLNLTNFYVFAQVGETVLDMVGEMIAETVVGEDGGRRVVSIASGKLVSSDITIGVDTGNWKSSSGSYYLVPVVPGDKMYIKASPTGATQYAFLTGIPVNPQAGETPNYATGCTLMFLNSSGSPEMGRTEVVPADARYMYVRTLHVPELVVAEGDAVKGYETWIEENYVSVKDSGGLRYKFYRIEDGVPYKAVIRIDAGVSVNAVLFFNEAGQEISGSGIWPGDGVEHDKVMEDVEMPAGTRYVRLQYKVVQHSGYYTSTGGAGLMRPLLYDGWVPTNKEIYCVSKVSAPVMPYDYDEADTTFPREDTWSAWAFMLPDVARSGAGKPFPLVSFFHGSSGFVTPDAMGYDAAGTDDGIVGRLLAAGCAVFDINGYGVSFHVDEHSQHWGCPLAVATVKKAYTILTERFNCRKGMVLSCISMGGAITKSYAMTYPEDCVACAMEAPSEMGLSFRDSTISSDKLGKMRTAWGLTAPTDINAICGYTPLANPCFIDTENGNVLVHRNASDWTYSDFVKPKAGATSPYSPIEYEATDLQASAPFPVESVIWQGDADDNVSYGYAVQFVRTARNAGSNVKLRMCPGCPHSLNTIPWVLEEVVEYIVDKVGC